MKAVVFASSLVLLMLSFVSCQDTQPAGHGYSGFISTFYGYLNNGGKPVDNLNDGLRKLCSLVDEAEWQRTQDVAEIPQKARGCMNKDILLECPADREIQVLAANIGRTSASVCDATKLNASGNSDDIQSCPTNNVTELLSTLCGGLQRCQYEVDSLDYSSVCTNVYPYAEVDYKCVKEKTTKTTYACQGNKLELKCKFGERILVKWANFGRMIYIARCITSSSMDYPCVSDVTDMVAAQCNELRLCTVTVKDFPNSNCTNPQFDYLDIQYICEKDPAYACANGLTLGVGENLDFHGHGYFDPRNWVRILQKMVEETMAPDSSTG